MSDNTETPRAAKGWTDAEKAELFMGVICTLKTIPWAQITLPEGRTEKACKLMLDKYRGEYRKAHPSSNADDAADNGDDAKKKASPKKRKAKAKAKVDGVEDSVKKAKKQVKAPKEESASEESG